jgi:anti-anti-sigma factor
VGIVIEQVGPRIYKLIGELDASNVASVDGVLEAEMPLSEDLTLDLSELTFVDSTGISLFVTLAQKLEGLGELILFSPDHSVRKVLELVGLHDRPNVKISGPPSDV